jgi:hypothetical protein
MHSSSMMFYSVVPAGWSSGGARPSFANSFSSSPLWCTIGQRSFVFSDLVKLTGKNDITATNELALDVKLGDGRPVTTTLAEALVMQGLPTCTP